MNLPNWITVLRIVLACVFGWLLWFLGESAALMAGGIFVVAAVSDFFDGYLARKYQLVTVLGKILDPIADKILIILALISFVKWGWLDALPVILIAIREVGITIWRMKLMAMQVILPAESLGKYKTVLQMFLVIGGLLMMNVLKDASNLKDILAMTWQIVIWVTVAFTWISAWPYIKGALKHDNK